MTTGQSESLKSYYQGLYAKFGNSHQSVQHVSKEAQNVRFKIFLEQISNKSRVVDLGCGLGDMLAFFRDNGFTGDYLGLDFVPEFIYSAEKKFSDDRKSKFKLFDIHSDAMPLGYDHVLISGVFNNKTTDNFSFMKSALTKSFAACEKSVIFNALSTYVEYEDPTLFYIDPMVIFDMCKQEMTPFVNLKHDYVTKIGGYPYEFTLSLYKESFSV